MYALIKYGPDGNPDYLSRLGLDSDNGFFYQMLSSTEQGWKLSGDMSFKKIYISGNISFFFIFSASVPFEDEAYPEGELLPETWGVEDLWRFDEPHDYDDGSPTSSHDCSPKNVERSRDTEGNAGDAKEHGIIKESGKYKQYKHTWGQYVYLCIGGQNKEIIRIMLSRALKAGKVMSSMFTLMRDFTVWSLVLEIVSILPRRAFLVISIK